MNRKRFQKPLLAMTFAFLLVFQTIVGVFPFQSTFAEGVEIKGDFLKNVIVEITDEHNTVTVDVYDRSVTEGVYEFDLGTSWDQDVKVDLTYEFALAEEDRDLIHENGGKGIFEFKLPAQFKLVGAHGGPLIDRGMEIGSYETNEASDGTITVTVHFDHPTYFNEFDNIAGHLDFSTELNIDELDNKTETEIKFDLEEEFTFKFKLKAKDIGNGFSKIGTPYNIDVEKATFNPTKIGWEIDINKATDDLKGATLSDTIPAGLKLVQSSFEIVELDVKLDGTLIEVNDVTNEIINNAETSIEDEPFKLYFGDITKAYRVKFDTNIVDHENNYENQAEFHWEGLSEPIPIIGDVDVSFGKRLAKTSSYEQTTQVVTWTINYNYDVQEIEHAVLEDWFDDVHILVADSVKVTPITIESDGTETSGTPLTEGDHYTLETGLVDASKENQNGFRITFRDTVKSAYQIEYQTKPPAYLDGKTKLQNTVTEFINGNHNGDVGVGREITPLVLQYACGQMDYENRQVEWTVTVYGTINNLGNATVEITPGDNLKYVTDSLKINDSFVAPATVTGDIYGAPFTVEINDATKVYKITYKTDYIDKTNGISNFNSTATISWDNNSYNPDNLQTTLVLNNNCDLNQEIKDNGFKRGEYNLEDKTITWEIGVNYNGQRLENARVTDVLTHGQVLDLESIKVYPMTIDEDGIIDYDEESYLTEGELGYYTDHSIWSDNPDNTNNKLDIRFNNTISDPYVIVFNTTYEGLPVNEPTVENTANLTADGEKGSKDLKGEVEIPHASELAIKSGKQNQDDEDFVDWTVFINRSQSYVENAKIEDEFSDNQVLLPDTLKIQEIQITGKGNGDYVRLGDPNTLDEGAGGYQFPAISNYTFSSLDNGFEINFVQPIEKAYILEYQTRVEAEHEEVVTNKVKFAGEQVDTSTELHPVEVKMLFSDSGGSASGSSRKITFEKVDSEDSEIKLEGAKFRLERMKSDGSWQVRGDEKETDVDGLVEFTGIISGSYQLIETQAPSTPYEYESGNNPVYEFTVTASDATVLEPVTITNERIKGSITLTKLDSRDDIELEGATFELYSVSSGTETLVKTKTTGSNGVIEFTSLDLGDYVIREVSSPTGYHRNTKDHPVSLNIVNQHETVTVENDRILGSLKITKVEEGNESEKLEGAEFSLYARAADGNRVGPVIDTKTTGNDGIAEFFDLELGRYILVEDTPPIGFSATATEYEIELTEQEHELEKVITNKIIPHSIEVTKVDDENGKLLEGAKFNLFIVDGNDETLIDSETTDEDGKLVFEGLDPRLEYKIVEAEAPTGYYLNSTAQQIQLDKNLTDTVKEVTFENERILGSLKITKVEEGNESLKLSGAEFSLFELDKNGDRIEPAKAKTTGRDGTATFSDLELGSYLLIEDKAPSGFRATVDGYEIEITASEYDVEKVITNKIITHSIELTKVDDENGRLLEGAKFDLYADVGGNETLINSGTTDAFGKLWFEDLDPRLTYTIVETEAPAGYYSNTTAHQMKLSATDLINPITIENERIKGDVTIVKYDEDDSTKQTRLKDATFELYLEDGQDRHLISTLTTDDNGEAHYAGLELGNYVLIETKAPHGYELSTVEYPFEVRASDTQIVQEISNELIRGSLIIEKYDDRFRRQLSGAVFELYHQDGNDYILYDTLTTDGDGRAEIDQLPLGQYMVKEVEAPRGYILDSTEHLLEFTISEPTVTYTATNRQRPSFPWWPEPEDSTDPTDPADPGDPDKPGPEDPEDPDTPRPDSPEGPDTPKPDDPEDPSTPDESGDTPIRDESEDASTPDESGDTPTSGESEDSSSSEESGDKDTSVDETSEAGSTPTHSEELETLPQTGEERLFYMLWLGMAFLILGSGILVYRKVKQQ